MTDVLQVMDVMVNRTVKSAFKRHRTAQLLEELARYRSAVQIARETNSPIPRWAPKEPTTQQALYYVLNEIKPAITRIRGNIISCFLDVGIVSVSSSETGAPMYRRYGFNDGEQVDERHARAVPKLSTGMFLTWYLDVGTLVFHIGIVAPVNGCALLAARDRDYTHVLKARDNVAPQSCSELCRRPS